MPHYRAPDGRRYLTDEPHEGWVLMTNAEVAAADAPRVAPPAVPEEISDRQFFQQLAALGKITEAEALDAVGPGIIPASMAALIDMLPPEQQFTARMLLSGATTFKRHHPLTPVLGGMYGLTEADLDALWIEGAEL